MAKLPIFIQQDGRDQEIQVGGPATIAACVLTTFICGYFSMHLANLDEGRVVTLQEMQAIVQKDAQRIQDDPHIPARAKRIALGQLMHAHLRKL